MKTGTSCPHCSTGFSLDSQLDGKKVRCSSCKQVFRARLGTGPEVAASVAKKAAPQSQSAAKDDLLNDPLFSDYVVDDMDFDDPLLQPGSPSDFDSTNRPAAAPRTVKKTVRRKKPEFNESRAQTGYSICGLGIVGMFAPLVGLELKFIGALGDGYSFFVGMIILIGCGFIMMASVGDLKKGFSLAAIPALVAFGGMIYSIALGTGVFEKGQRPQASASNPRQPVFEAARPAPTTSPGNQSGSRLGPRPGSGGTFSAFEESGDDDDWGNDGGSGGTENAPVRSRRPGTEIQGTPATLEDLRPGRAIHIQWGASWFEGSVIKTEGQSVRVHYDGWSETFDETVELERVRLAEEKR